MSDRYSNVSIGPEGFGRRGSAITPADADLAEIAKAVVVTGTAGGNVLQVLPVDNTDGDWVVITDVVVGYMPPYQIRRVGPATTCTVASVLDRDLG